MMALFFSPGSFEGSAEYIISEKDESEKYPKREFQICGETVKTDIYVKKIRNLFNTADYFQIIIPVKENNLRPESVIIFYYMISDVNFSDFDEVIANSDFSDLLSFNVQLPAGGRL